MDAPKQTALAMRVLVIGANREAPPVAEGLAESLSPQDLNRLRPRLNRH